MKINLLTWCCIFIFVFGFLSSCENNNEKQMEKTEGINNSENNGKKEFSKIDLKLKKITKDNKEGYADEKGTVVVEPKYMKVYKVKNGLIPATEDGIKWGYIDQTGTVIIDFQYDEVRGLESPDGPLFVKKKGMWGVIDLSGKLIVDYLYNNAYGFYKGLGNVLVDDKWGFIDEKGKMLYEPEYDQTATFDSITNKASMTKNGKKVILNLETRKFE